MKIIFILTLFLITSFISSSEQISRNPINKPGFITGKEVRLRSSPNLKSDTIMYLEKWVDVFVYEKSNEKEKIDDDDYYWYKIQYLYHTGWIYGKYVMFGESIWDSIYSIKSNIGLVYSLPDDKSKVLAFISKIDKFISIRYDSSESKAGWRKIKYLKYTGWIKEDIISIRSNITDYKERIPNLFIRTESEGAENYQASLNVYFLKKGENKPIKKSILVSASASSGFEVSDSGTYLAYDWGTDVQGVLEIYDLQNNKLLHRIHYDRGLNKWNKECISYNKTLSLYNGCSVYEEESFCDGKIISSGRKGKGAYHSFGKNDPECEKTSPN